MKNRGLVIAIAAVVAILAIIFIVRPIVSKGPAEKISKTEKTKTAAALPAKKAFAKGMGGLTVKIKGSKDKPQYLRVRAFNADGKNSSVFISAFGSERMQELPQGAYDIEIDTLPVKLYKNIKVSEGKETIEDLGAIAGSLNVKALNSKKKEAPVTVKVIQPRSNLMVTIVTANRPADIVSGVYNLDIETLPPQTKNGVKIEAGKETLLDLGVVSGSVIVKAVNGDGKEVRAAVRIKNPANNAIVTSTTTNRALELMPGEYDIEILSTPAQAKKGVRVNAGEETAVEVSIKNPPAAQQPAPAKRK